jgi:hypothetical protein
VESAAPSFFAAKRCRAGRETESALNWVLPGTGLKQGGAMAEEERACGNEAGQTAEDSVDAADLLAKAAKERFQKNLPDIMDCVESNIKNNNLQAAKTLVDWADRRVEYVLPEEQCESLAEVLWRSLPESCSEAEDAKESEAEAGE